MDSKYSKVGINTLACHLCSKWCQTFGGRCTYMNVCDIVTMSLQKLRAQHMNQPVQLVIPAGEKPLSEPMMVSLLTHICITRPQWNKQMEPHWTGCPDSRHQLLAKQLTNIHRQKIGQPSVRDTYFLKVLHVCRGHVILISLWLWIHTSISYIT